MSWARLGLRVAVMAAVLAGPALAWGQMRADQDGDGLPDEVEERLGTDARRAEALTLVIDDKVAGQGDRSVGRALKLANDIVSCWVGHVGGDRYLIKVTLARPFNATNSVFHIYVDWDHDPSTGRQDADWVRGCDIMYSIVNGQFSPRFFSLRVRAEPELMPRCAILGDTVYVCDDVKPHISEKAARFRIYVLSHMADDTSDSDNTPWAEGEVALSGPASAPALAVPRRRNFEVLPGDWELVAGLWHAPTTILLKPSQAEISGFELQHDESLVGKGAPEERVVFTVPTSGARYICCVVYQPQTAAPGLEVAVNDRPVGSIAVAPVACDQVLVYSAQPVALQAGDRLRFAAAPHAGPVRVGMFMLTAQRPQMPPLRLANIRTYSVPERLGQPPARVVVSWTTNRPASCTVRYELADGQGRQQAGELAAQPGQGHRCFYVVLDRANLGGARYALQIRAQEADLPPYWKGQAAAATATVEMSAWEPPAEKAGAVQLTVSEPTSNGRRWPVRSGVPLPPGCLWDPSHCELLGPEGQPIAAQFVCWARWPQDNSVQWLVVDFVAQTSAHRPAVYRLRYGRIPPRRSEPGIRISQSQQGLVVEGTRLRLVLEPQSPLGQVWADRDGDGKIGEGESVLANAPLTLTTSDGIRLVGGPPDETVVEESGPLHGVVRRAGWFTAPDGRRQWRYLLRVHVWRDLPRLYLEISLDNANVDSDMSLLQRLALELPIRADGIWLGGEEVRPLSEQPTVLLQDYDLRYLVNGQPAGEHHGGGIALLQGAQPVVLAVVRDFWKLWPKGFTASSRGLSVELLPALPADAYQSPQDQALVDRLFFWCDHGQYKLRCGTRVTSEVLLDFAPAAQPTGLAAEVEHVHAPLFAAATAEHYCASGAFGPVYAKQAGLFSVYDENVEASFAEFMQRQQTQREYGFMNYGDWYGERNWNWGNIEYDTPWALALQFAHNGRLDMLWRAEAAARHNVDVDTVHYHRNPALVGKVWIHCLGHTGGYFPPSFKDMGEFALGGSSHCHTWVQGNLVCSALFGNERLRDTALLVADEIVRSRTPYCRFYARDAGWALIALCATYQLTANPWYLNAAWLVAERMLQRQEPDTGRMGAHLLDGAECKHQPRHYGAKPFMTAVMLRGLRMYDQLEPRAEVKQAIVRCADWMWNEAWVPKDHGFWYSQCPTFMDKGQPWTFCLAGDGLAYACLLDREHFARRRAQLIEACAAHLYRAGRGGFGKSFTQLTCCMLHALEFMRRLGIRELPPPSTPQARPQLQMRSVVVMQPGEKREVYAFIDNPGLRSQRVEGEVEEAPGWLRVKMPEATTIPAARSAALPTRLTCAAGAPVGSEGQLRLRVRIGSLSESRLLRVVVRAPQPLGSGIGIVTGEHDYLAPALASLGLQAEPLQVLEWTALRKLKALIVGDEALVYNYGQIRSHLAEVQYFVLSGGLLVSGQLNDTGWDAALLPWDLFLAEPETAAGELADRQHPLFAALSAEALQGVKSYDCVIWAAPQWRVLMRDREGRPAVAEAQYGRGRALFILPSFDRPVVGASSSTNQQAAACRQFLQNLIRCLQA
jgi:hypothetical protein